MIKQLTINAGPCILKRVSRPRGHDVISPEILITGIVELIVGSGFAKWVLGLHTKVTVLENEAAEAKKTDEKVSKLNTEVEVLKAQSTRIEEGLKKLDMLGELKATVEALKDRLDEKFMASRARPTRARR
jgi:hypothetical protein